MRKVTEAILGGFAHVCVKLTAAADGVVEIESYAVNKDGDRLWDVPLQPQREEIIVDDGASLSILLDEPFRVKLVPA